MKTNSRKDFFGYDTFVGDEVAFNPPYYKGLLIGHVESITPKGFRVKYFRSQYKDYPVTTVFELIKRQYNASNLSIGNTDGMS